MYDLVAQAIIDDRHRAARHARRVREWRRGRTDDTGVRDILAALLHCNGTRWRRAETWPISESTQGVTRG
jgi:hypothetical protein